MRAGGERVQALLDYMVQTTHPGTIELDGDTASGRAYMSELTRVRDGRSELNFAIYHDRYQRTGDGWKFTERVYEVRYLDATPLAGSAPRTEGGAQDPAGPGHVCGGRKPVTGAGIWPSRPRSCWVTGRRPPSSNCFPEPDRCARPI